VVAENRKENKAMRNRAKLIGWSLFFAPFIYAILYIMVTA
jgi:hypothetical protein